MKTISTFALHMLVFTAITLPLISFGQYSPGSPANFGIDGDLKNDYRMSGSFTAAGTHDWFKLIAGSGIGIIDTANTSSYATSLAAGNNISFSLGMSVSPYSIVDGKMLLDARYARDQFGKGPTAATMDNTSFTGSKNGQDPTTWATVPAGSPVGDKYDIVDAFMHLRRDGTEIAAPTPSHLIANFGISTVGITGVRYFDAELYCTKLTYDGSTGLFSNSGPASTGGHTAWTFNADGSIKQFGDLTISFSFSSSVCNEIYIMVWVSQANFLSVNPAGFDFIPGEYYGTSGGYGYAKIKPDSGAAIAWGVGNAAIGTAPPWGTNSKTLGNSSLNGYSSSYDVGQFGEAAIDLTALGVDPASKMGTNACMPPYNRILFKSRSSASFTSNLQDFAGPYEFFDLPEAKIAPPAILKCNVPTVTLTAATIASGASYQWTTSDGSIVSDPNSPSVTVNKTGKYYLTAGIYPGCSTKIDSVNVSADYYKPVASASSTGILITRVPEITATLNGGNAAASNYMTPYGSSAGLAWSWSGPNGFASTKQDTITNQAGNYTLVLTELRNGCKDTANISLLSYTVLPVKYISFDAVALDNNSVNLKWITDFEQNDSHYELERSFDSKNFTTISVESDGLFPFETRKAYEYNDKSPELQKNQVVYYRLNQVYKTGKSIHSKVLAVKLKSNALMQISPNPFIESLTFRFNSLENAKGEIRIINSAGKTILSQSTTVAKGYNDLQVGGLTSLPNGLYIAQLLRNGAVISNEKIIKN